MAGSGEQGGKAGMVRNGAGQISKSQGLLWWFYVESNRVKGCVAGGDLGCTDAWKGRDKNPYVMLCA